MSLSSKSVSNSILSSLESIKTEVQFPCEERRFILLCHIQLETSHEVKPSPKADQNESFLLPNIFNTSREQYLQN